MNILLLCEGDAETRASWSGISKSVLDELRRQGHHVTACNADLRGPARWMAAAVTFAPDRRRWGVKYRLLPLPSSLRTRRARAFIAARGRDVDCILQIGATFEPLGHGTIPYFVYCDSNIAMAQHGRFTGHSPARHLLPSELDCVIARERKVYRSAAGVFAIHERLRRSFIDDFGVPESRVATVYGGPNFDIGRVPRRDSAARTSKPTILFVGAQFERKGGDILLAAFRRVLSRVPDAQLVIVGPEQRVSEQPGVRSVGYLDKDTAEGWEALVAAYLNADVFCLPTRFEPFGIAFLEAMCFELPCVGTNLWALPELIDEGETGFLVPVDDTDALADRLIQLLCNRERARAMGRAGRARFERMFTWQAVISRMMRLIEPVVHNRHMVG